VQGSAYTGRRLLAVLTDLRTAVADLRLPLEVAGADDDRQLAHRLRDQLDDHLLPRVRQLGAPLLAVVGGSTGAGKSTLVNSLVRDEVSMAGVLRPTTRSPVLVHHPDEAAWFSTDRILPRLARATGAATDDGVLRLVPHLGVPHGLALLDAPDIDSVVVENRRLGEELLGAADLWVFVTTAARYADAVPWDLLAEAARRRAVVVLVLNRMEPAARTAVTRHLREMLVEHGLDAQVVVVPESRVEGGLLPVAAVAELGGWLRAVVGDVSARDGVVQRTVRGAIDDLLVAGLRLSRASADLRERVAEQVRAWQAAVLDLVVREGAGRRSTARALSFGVNGLGAALMITIFASTGGLTTAEVGVAGGTAVLAQRLLEAVFGDDAVRRLTQMAHEDLLARIDRLLDAEAARFLAVLDAADVRPEAAERIRAAVAGLTIVAVELGAAQEAVRVPATPAVASAEEERPEGTLKRWWRWLRGAE